MTRILALVCAALFALTVGVSGTALAKPKVALTPIEGDPDGDLRDAIAEALDGKELALIGSKEVNRAVDKLGDVSELTEKDCKKLATELEADAVVLAKLDKVGNAKTLKFRLFVHKKMAKGFTVSFKDPKSEKFRTVLHDKMVDKIGTTGHADDDKTAKSKKVAAEEAEEEPAATKPGKKDKKGAKKTKLAEEDVEAEEPKAKKSKAAAVAAEEEDVKPAKKTKAAAEEDVKPAKKTKAAAAEETDEPRSKKAAAAEETDEPKAKKSKASEEDTTAEAEAGDAAAKPEGDGEDGEGGEEPRKAKKQVASASEDNELGLTATASPMQSGRPANRFAVRVDVGGSMVRRNFKFNASGDSGLPKSLSFNPVPGARVEAELYPMALGSGGGVLSSFGVGVEYDRTLAFKLQRAAGGMTVSAPIKQSHYSAGLRYRQMFGDKPTSPSLTLGVGYGKRLFSPDRSKLDGAAALEVARDLPQTNYVVIDPGVMFRAPLGRMLAISLGGHGLIITDAGGIQSGNSYGRGSVSGFDAEFGFEVLISKFALRLSADFAQIGFKFESVGALSNGLGEAGKVGGLTDRSIGGAATLAAYF